MRVFIDTSAFLAILAKEDINHAPAKRIWTELIHKEATLSCTNYVILESFALVQRRLGLAAVKTFEEDIVPILHLEWVDEPLHQAGVAALLTARRRQLSLVDCISFETMRRLRIDTVFAFDQHFVEQGFTCLS